MVSPPYSDCPSGPAHKLSISFRKPNVDFSIAYNGGNRMPLAVYDNYRLELRKSSKGMENPAFRDTPRKTGFFLSSGRRNRLFKQQLIPQLNCSSNKQRRQDCTNIDSLQPVQHDQFNCQSTQYP